MSFLSWHFIYVPKNLSKVGRNFIIFFYHFFSIKLLFQTLFSPFKRAFRTKAKAGFSPSEILERLSFNIISRIIGALIRTTTIFVGLISQALVVIGWFPLILLWLLTPPLSFLLYLQWKANLAKKDLLPQVPRSTKPQNARKYLEKLLKSEFGKFICSRLMLNPQENLQAVEPDLQITETSKTYPHIMTKSPGLHKYFFDKNITVVDVQNIYDWYFREKKEQNQKQQFWSLENLLRIPSIGKQWAYGYTPVLDMFTIDLGLQPVPFGKLFGRTKEIEAIERILIKKSENSCFVIGETGVGVHPLIIKLAHLTLEGRVLPQLEAKRILKLDLERLFGEFSDQTQQKAYLTAILDEARMAGNIVLVIDEFDRFVTSRQDRIDLTDVFIHTLSRGGLQIIALLHPSRYEQFVHTNNTLTALFDAVEISEPTPDQTLLILQSILPTFEEHGVFFPYQTLKTIITLTDRYIKDMPFPEKAIDVLDAVTTRQKTRKDKNVVVLPTDIEKIITEKTKTPVSISKYEKETLLNLDKILHQRIINQRQAVSAVSKSLRRARADVSVRKNRPIGTFLFLGPTGVGKTETVKALTHSFFGSERRMNRFDMSEYRQEDAITRLLGDFKTGSQGLFATTLRENPYTLLLLDEFEKAHPKVFNLFLSGFDEGIITDAFGKKIYLTNTIIIATSNAGSEFIRRRVKESTSGIHLQTELIEYVQRKKIFTPELLNRFDEVVVFEPLKAEHVEKILDLLLVQLNKKLEKDHGITVKLTDITRKKVFADGYNAEFGARALKRALQHHVENPLSEKILRDEVERGAVVTI